MSFFLYKPHVHGPDGITTPDVIIDAFESDIPAMMGLTSETFLRLAEGKHTLTPCLALVPTGGGTLIAPMMQIEAGPSVLFRRAVRLTHTTDNDIHITFGREAAQIKDSLIEQRKRGIAVCKAIEAIAPVGVALHRKGGQDLYQQRVDMTFSWGVDAFTVSLHLGCVQPALEVSDTTNRYAIGPTRKDVKHYNIIGRD